jgi:hypothetical protein
MRPLPIVPYRQNKFRYQSLCLSLYFTENEGRSRHASFLLGTSFVGIFLCYNVVLLC